MNPTLSKPKPTISPSNIDLPHKVCFWFNSPVSTIEPRSKPQLLSPLSSASSASPAMSTPTPSTRHPRHRISDEFSSAKTSQSLSGHKKKKGRKKPKLNVSGDPFGLFKPITQPEVAFPGQHHTVAAVRNAVPTSTAPAKITVPTLNQIHPSVGSNKPPGNITDAFQSRQQAPSPTPKVFSAKFPSDDSDSEPLSHRAIHKPTTTSLDTKVKPKDKIEKDKILKSKQHLANLQVLHPNRVLAQAKMEARRLQLHPLVSGFDNPPRKRRRNSDSSTDTTIARQEHEEARKVDANLEALWAKIKPCAQKRQDKELNSLARSEAQNNAHYPPASDPDFDTQDETDQEDDPDALALSTAEIIPLESRLPRHRAPKLTQKDFDAAYALRADLPSRLLEATQHQALRAAVADQPDATDKPTRLSELSLVLTAARAMIHALMHRKPADDLVRAANRLVGAENVDPYAKTTRKIDGSKVYMPPETVELLRIAEERQVEIERLRIKVERLSKALERSSSSCEEG